MAKKVYVLSELMAAAKSGFFIEGTDIMMNFPEEYPLPLETQVLEDGAPVILRVVPGSKDLIKENQIKNGYPANYAHSDSERKKVTFKYGRLELDDFRDKIYCEFIDRTAWLEGNEAKKFFNNTKTIIQLYDEQAILESELVDEELITKAKMAVFGLDEKNTKALYMLSVGGNYKEGSLTLKHMKRHLVDIADQNPDFIINGIKTEIDNIKLLVTKAMEYGKINFDVAGMVAIHSNASNDWEPLIEVSDAGGAEGKFNKTVDYFGSEAGHASLGILKSMVETHEAGLEK